MAGLYHCQLNNQLHNRALVAKTEKRTDIISIFTISFFLTPAIQSNNITQCAHKCLIFSKGDIMNITLSADKETINKSRQYAKEHSTSLNSIIRNYLKKISGESDRKANAEEFGQLAETKAGCSKPDFKFDRNEIHARGH